MVVVCSILILVASILPIWKYFVKELRMIRQNGKDSPIKVINPNDGDKFIDSRKVRPVAPSIIMTDSSSSSNPSSEFRSVIEVGN